MSSVQVYFNGTEVTINKGSYNLHPTNKQTINETEGGTLRRYIKRLGVPHISVSMPANESEYGTLYTAYTSGSTITVKYFNPGSGTLETFYGFIEDFSAEAVYETSTDSEWNLTFEIASM